MRKKKGSKLNGRQRKNMSAQNTILSLCDVTCEDDFEIQQNDRKKRTSEEETLEK